MTFFDGDDDNGKSSSQSSESGPVEPGELQVPQGVGTILGSQHEDQRDSKLL